MVLCCLISVSTPFKADAATGINHQINFQGKLVNTNGTNVTNGTYSIVFSIYSVASAGTAIWTETQTPTVTDGIFQVTLGSSTTLPGSIDFNTDNIYLGIKVGADAEMTPRIQFTAVPQAFNSEKLGGVDKTGFVQLGQGAMQNTSTATSSVQINQQGAGNILQLQGSGTDVFTLSNAGNITLGNNADHTLSVTTSAASTAGRKITISAGAAGTGVAALAGGDIVVQAGAGGGTNGAGGNLTFNPGIKNGTGAAGVVLFKPGAAGNDSVTFLQIQPAGSTTPVFNVDTTNLRIGLGTSSPDASLHIVGGGVCVENAETTCTGLTQGNIAVNGGTIQTSSTTGSVFNATVTNLSIGGAATTLSLGGSGGTATLGNGGAFTVQSSSNQNLTITGNGSGDVVHTTDADTNLQVTATAAPGVDQVAITNAGQAATTAGVNNLSLNFVGGAAAVEAGAQRIDLQPGATASGIWNGLRFVHNATGPATNVTSTGVKLEGPTTGGAGTYNGINIANIGAVASSGVVRGINITGTNSQAAGNVYGIQLQNLTAGAATERGIDLGTGWDALLTYNGGTTTIVNGTGQLNLSSVFNSLADANIDNNITVDWTGLQNYPTACSAGQAITALADVPTCSTFATVDTNTTYSAGNDLDLTGTTFDIESQLDSVSTISRAASDLTLQTTTSGNINITTGAAAGLVNVLTGNLKVGNGTPTVALNGEDAYIEGTLEVGGNVVFTAGLAVSGAAVSINNSSNFSTSINGGTSTGQVDVGTGTGIQTLNFGTGGTGAKTVTVGSTASTSSLLLQSGTGSISLLGGKILANGVGIGSYDNFIDNFGFETGNEDQGWVNSANYTLESTDTRTGNYAVTSTSTGGNVYYQHAVDIPTQAGENWYGEIWIKAIGSAGQGSLRFNWKQKNGTDSAITPNTYPGFGATTADTWTKISGIATAPADAAYVRIFIRTGSGTTGVVHIYDDIFVSKEIDTAQLSTNGTTRITSSGLLQNVTNADASTFFTGGLLPVARGGTGVGTTPSNGQLLIGNGTNYTVASLTGTGLTVTPGAGTLALSVNYGSGANNAAAGSNTFTCPSGSGNLTGGGTVVTLGTSGTTCGAISTNNAVTFSTSVTSPIFQNAGAVTLGTTATAGADDILFSTAGTEKWRILENGNFQRTAAGTTTIDVIDGSNTTLALTNSGTGVLNVTTDGSITATGTIGGSNFSGTHSGTSSGTNTGDVSLAGQNYLSIVGQTITANAINLSGTHITSTLGAGNGGTGLASYTVGDLIYASAGTTLSKLAAVASGSCLISQGVTTAPTWGSCAATASFTAAGTSGSNQTISNGDTLTIAAGTNITTTGGATDTITIATVANPSFATSVTTPSLTNTAGLTLNATSAALTLQTTTSGNVVINAGGAGTLDVQDNATFAGTVGVTGTLTVSSITTATNTNLSVTPNGTGDVVLNTDADTNVQITAGGVPAADQLAISNAGQAVTTAGVNNLSLNFVGGAAAVESGAARIDLTPGTTSGGTWNGLRFVAAATGAVSGVTENAIKLQGPTSLGAGTENAITFDTNWDNLIQSTNFTVTAAGALSAGGAITATGAVTGSNLSGTNTGNVTLSGENYLSLAGQAITVSSVALGGTNVSGTLPVGRGGTGVTTTPTNGQLLIGNGTNYTVATLGATGLTVTPGAGTLSLSVNYGSAANNAAAGANTFTCPSGSGNLTGGGTVVTIGTSGTTCGAISTNNAVTFSTSVTTPSVTNTGALTLNATSAALALQTTTSGDITLTTAAAAGLVNVLTGNLKVGNGTPTVALNGEDAYIEGTLEADGSVNFAGTLAVGGNTTLTGDIAVNGGDITSTGALNITPGGALVVGVLGQSTTVQGSTTSIYSNGAVNIGTNAVAQTVTIGNNTTTSSVVVNTGTGGVSIGANGIANTIQIGNTSGAVAQTINIGTNATGSSTNTVNIGSTIAGVTTLQSAGGVAVTTLSGTTGATLVCRNASNLLSTCTPGTGIDTLQSTYDNDTDGGDVTLTSNSTDGNLIFAFGNAQQFNLTSDLTVAVRSTALLNITQADNATFNSTGALLAITQSDTGSSGAGLSVTQNGVGNGILVTVTTNAQPAVAVVGPASGDGFAVTGVTSGRGYLANTITTGTGLTANGITTGTGLNIGGSAFTTGDGFRFNTNSNVLSTGTAINISGSAAGITANATGHYIDVAPSRTLTAAATRTDTARLLSLARTNTVNNASGTFNVQGDVASFSSNCTQTAGTCTDNSNILQLQQSYANASGEVLNVIGAGTGNLASFDTSNASANGLRVEIQSSSQTQYALGVLTNNGANTAFVVRGDGRVGIGAAIPNYTLDVQGTTTAISGTNILHSSELTVSPASAPGAATSYSSIFGRATTASTNVNANTSLYGLYGESKNTGTGTLGGATGTFGVVTNSAGGVITTAVGLSGQVINSGAGSVTGAYAIAANSPNIGAGSIGTAVGVSIGAQKISGVTGVGYGIFQAGTSDVNLFAGSIVASGAATATTGTTAATPQTNTTTVTLTAAGSFANNDVIFIDNSSGQDYYTRIVSGGGTTTLTVSPAVSYLASTSVTKYNVPSIGATISDYTTLSNRFFQGYFLGGVVTGAGSTTLSDGVLQSTNNLYLQTGTQSVGIGGSTPATSDFFFDNSSGQMRFNGIGANSRLTFAPISGGTQNLMNFDNSAGTFRLFRENYSTTGGGSGGVVLLTVTDTGIFTQGGPINLSTTTPQFILDNAATSTQSVMQFSVAGTARGRIRADSSGNIVMNGTGTGAVYLGYDTGTGGTYFGNGAGTTVARVTSGGGFFWSGSELNADAHGGSMELGSANTPFIDFSNDAVSDYDMRMILAGDDQLTITGGRVVVDDILEIAGSGNSQIIIDDRDGSGSFSLYDSGDVFRVYSPGGDRFTAWTDGHLIAEGNLGFKAAAGIGASSICRGAAVNGITGAYDVGICSSLLKYKQNINNLSLGIDTLRQLRPVEYDWKDPTMGGHDLGFIAEEVNAINPLLAEYANGQLSGVKYNLLTSLITKSVQQLDGQVQQQQSQINGGLTINTGQSAAIASLENRVFDLEQQLMTSNFDALNVSGAADINNLTVTGSATIHSLLVTGDVSIQGKLTVAGDVEVANLFVNGKLVSKGNAPQTALGAALTGVLGASVTNNGTDTAGTVSITSGSQAAQTGVLAEVTFTAPYTTAPKIVISGNNAKSAKLGAYVVRTANGFQIVTDDVVEQGANYEFDYVIIQTVASSTP